MSASVWAVEQGGYSDYQVVAVFDNLDAAQQHADRLNASDSYESASVAEWPLRSEPPKLVAIHCCEMSERYGIRTWTYDAWDYGDGTLDDAMGVNMFPGRVASRARTPDEARKAALDRLAMEQAHKEGLA